MPLNITGADREDRGPAGCVVRFMIAGEAQDVAAATLEVHPDFREQIGHGVSSPPGVVAAAVGEPQQEAEWVLVPTTLTGEDGSEQPFKFVVRPVGDGWGIDLAETMKVTFGGDPAEMMIDAMRAAVAPLGEAMSHMGEALGDAFGGGGGGGETYGGDAPPAPRRIAIDEAIPGGDVEAPSSMVARILRLELRRQVQRGFDDTDFTSSTELSVKLQLVLPPEWTASRCLGATIERAQSVEGEDLRPQDASEELGSERYASWEAERREFPCSLQLASPTQPFTGLAELSGRVRLDASGGEPLEIVLGPVGELLGKTVHLAAFDVGVAFERDPDGYLVLTAPDAWFNRLTELRPVDSSGEGLGESWSGSSDGETCRRTYQSEVPDDGSLLARFSSRAAQLEVQFTTDGLPLSIG